MISHRARLAMLERRIGHSIPHEVAAVLARPQKNLGLAGGQETTRFAALFPTKALP